MSKSLLSELRYLFPAWIFCVLLPTPLFLFPRLSAGRSYELMCFALGCAILVAYSFRRDIRPPGTLSAGVGSEPPTWRERMLPLGMALFAASSVFSMFSFSVNNPHNFVTPMLAFMVPGPALGIVPYMVLVTRQSFAGVLFSIILVGSLKTPIGAMIVHTFFPSRFVQAPDADGALIMPTPWDHPNMAGMVALYVYRRVFPFVLFFRREEISHNA